MRKNAVFLFFVKHLMVQPSYMTQCFEFIFPFTYKVLAAESPNSTRKIFVCYFKVHRSPVFKTGRL